MAILSDLWIIAPQNPEDMLDWPADLTLHMQKYQSIKAQLRQELQQ